MANVSTWNFFNQNVQSGLLEGRFMNAAFTLIAAGPPRLGATTLVASQDPAAAAPGGNLGDIAYPIGIIQSFNIGQNSQWMRLWEIGSERSYFIRGRTQGQIGLGRIMYHGPNLLRVLYAYLGSENGAPGFGAFSSLYENSAKALLNTANKPNAKDTFNTPPGYENIWLDLASDVFSQPIGLLLYLRDSNEDTVGAFYVEYCNVANHGFSTDAGGTIISEQASLMYERIRPIKMTVVPLIADSESIKPIVGSTVVGSAAGPALGGNTA
jgi:hypothetical protein